MSRIPTKEILYLDQGIYLGPEDSKLSYVLQWTHRYQELTERSPIILSSVEDSPVKQNDDQKFIDYCMQSFDKYNAQAQGTCHTLACMLGITPDKAVERMIETVQYSRISRNTSGAEYYVDSLSLQLFRHILNPFRSLEERVFEKAEPEKMLQQSVSQ